VTSYDAAATTESRSQDAARARAGTHVRCSEEDLRRNRYRL